MSGAACAPGHGGAHLGRAGSLAATRGGDHQQPAPRQPGLQHSAHCALGSPETCRVREHFPAGAQRALLHPAVSPEGEKAGPAPAAAKPQSSLLEDRKASGWLRTLLGSRALQGTMVSQAQKCLIFTPGCLSEFHLCWV